MNKLPALLFYPGDWKKDPGIQALSYEERGIWFEVLLLMHECEPRGKLTLNGAPMSLERLANLLGLDKQKINNTINTFLELGVASLCPDTGALINRRMVRDETIRQKRSEAGQAGGGNPAFLKGKANPYYKLTDKHKDKQKDKQKINNIDKQKIGSSFSVSSSSSIKRKYIKENISSPIPVPEDFEISEAVLTWFNKKYPNTEINLEIEKEKFINHHTAKGNTFKNLDAAFRNWVMNAINFQCSKPQQKPKKSLFREQYDAQTEKDNQLNDPDS